VNLFIILIRSLTEVNQLQIDPLALNLHNFLGTYLVHIDSSCTNRAHELTKHKKNLKTFIHVLFILLYLCIKFQRQISSNEGAVKKTKISNRSIVEICQKFLFFYYR
jgi:hypothetical protein